MLLMLFTVFSLATGQVLFKLGAVELTGESVSELVYSFISNVYLIAVVFLYGLTIISWLWILKKTPLSVAYPMTAASYIVVPVLCHYILGERISLNMMVGFALIFLGIVFIAWK